MRRGGLSQRVDTPRISNSLCRRSNESVVREPVGGLAIRPTDQVRGPFSVLGIYSRACRNCATSPMEPEIYLEINPLHDRSTQHSPATSPRETSQ